MTEMAPVGYLYTPASRAVSPPGTRLLDPDGLRWRVGAVGLTGGERYYWLTGESRPVEGTVYMISGRRAGRVGGGFGNIFEDQLMKEDEPGLCSICARTMGRYLRESDGGVPAGYTQKETDEWVA